MPNVELAAIRQVMLPYADFDRAVGFYRDVLGARLIGSFPPGIAFFDIAGVRLLLEEAHHGAGPSEGCVYFAVDDIDEAYRELAAAGVDFTQPPHLIFPDAAGTFGPAGEEEWMAFFRDSEGNTLALASRRAPQGG